MIKLWMVGVVLIGLSGSTTSLRAQEAAVSTALPPAAPSVQAPAPQQCGPVLTSDESRALVQLMDMGVKFGGLAVAGNANWLATKLKLAPVVTQGQ